MRLRAVLLLSLVCATGCGDEPWCKPGPVRTERWSDEPPVVARLRDGCGFPDNQVEYHVMAHGKLLFADNMEHFNRRHAIERHPDGSVEITIWDRACVVTATTATCREVDYRRWP